jgi:Zn-finger nucleic acid-binding protein
MTVPNVPPAAVHRCPKCSGTMHTYERNGVHLEQCDTCRGIFLDFGELEALTQLEARMNQAPPAYHPGPAPYQQPPQGYPQQVPPGYGPGWGHHGSHTYRKGGFGRLFFSS